MLKPILTLAICLVAVSSSARADLMVKIVGTLDSFTQDNYVIRVKDQNKKDALVYIDRKQLSAADAMQFPAKSGSKVAARVNGRSIASVRAPRN